MSVCRDPNFTGVCQVFSSDIPDLNGSTVGDNTITSVDVPVDSMVELYEHPNYQGKCQAFLNSDGWLPWSVVGDDTASSLKVRAAGFSGGCKDITVQTQMRGINHFETFNGWLSCPYSYAYAMLRNWNASSPGVSAAADSVMVTYTNWNLTGDQVAGLKYVCSSDPNMVRIW